LIYLAWIASKVKAVTPALPAGGDASPSTSGGGIPKVAGGTMGIPGEVQPTTKRRKSRKTTTPKTSGSTVASTNDDDGSSKGEDASKAVIKRFIRAFKQ
jgi:hypothetical protein